MAYTTTPNELDTKRGLRAGLLGLAALAVAGIAALGFSVVTYDSSPVPAAVDFPTQDEMRAENMEIRHQIAAAAAAAEAPVAVDLPIQDQMRQENVEIREQTGAGVFGAADAPAGVVTPSDEAQDEDPVIRPTKELP